MSQHLPSPILLETMRMEHGEIPLLALHQDRLNRSRAQVCGQPRPLNLRKSLHTFSLPDQNGLFKLRVLYDEQIQEVHWEAYTPRVVRSLQVVDAGNCTYTHKWADRGQLEQLMEQRQGCDDILITRHGFLTDASYANLALYDGRCWWTPAHPLLRGVRRAQLLQTGELRPAIIRLADLVHFKYVRLFNAMIDLTESPDIPVQAIVR